MPKVLKHATYKVDARAAADPAAAEQAVREALDASEREWVATERSDLAEEALTREYRYHMLRAEELRHFLNGCGISLAGDH